MALPVEEISQLLLANDVEHSIGSVEFALRRNLLVKIADVFTKGGSQYLEVMKFQPEGYGYHERLRFHTTMPEMSEHSTGLIQWSVEQEVPPQQTMLWLLKVDHEQFLNSELQIGYIFDKKSRWLRAPCSTLTRDLKVLELFSGSFGGWKGAMDRMHETTDFNFQSVSVDWDAAATCAFSLTHSTNLLRSSEHLPADLFANSTEDWTVCTDVLDEKLTHALSHWGPTIATVSSPCPPWSRSGHGGGFNRPEGFLLLQVLMMLRFLQVTFILVEQVATITDHSHFEALRMIIHWMGFRIVWQRIADLQDISKVARPRWLAVLERIHANIPSHPGQIWKRVARTLLPDPRIRLPMEHKLSMRIDAEVYRIAQDPDYMKHKGKSWAVGFRDIDILGLRTYQGGTIPCFTARYGTQHMLDEDMLRQQGYHCHFAPESDFEEGVRYWHPAEVAIMHGICKPTWLPSDNFRAWFGLGNQISIQHAMLGFVNALCRAFEPRLDLEQVLTDFAAHRFGSTGLEFRSISKGYMICLRGTLFTKDFLDAAEQLNEFMESREPTYWSPKHGIRPVSQAHWTLQSALTPESQCSEEASDIEDCSPVLPGRIFFEDHTEAFWFSAKIPGDSIRTLWSEKFMCEFHSPPNSSLLDLHLRPSDFQSSTDNDSCVPAVIDKELTLVLCTPSTLLDQPQIQQLGDLIFDQFGLLGSNQKATYDTLLLTSSLPHDNLQMDFVHLLGAFTQLHTKWIFQLERNTLTCHLSGPAVDQAIWGSFWTFIFPVQVQECLGRTVTFYADDQKVAFTPLTQGVVPNAQFRLGLAVIASRSILDNLAHQILPAEKIVHVTFKFHARPLWSGLLPVGISVDILFSVLQIGLGVLNQHGPWRILCDGKQVMNEQTLAYIASERTEIRLHVVQPMHGGGAKQQQKQVHQSSLAATLLEHGFHLSWVTPTVDTLIDKTSIQKLNSITSMAMGAAKIQAIKQLCHDNGLDLPAPIKPQSGKSFPGAPWNKKPRTEMIDPAQFTLVPNYFFNEDGTVANQITSVRAQTSGLCLMTSQQAAPWLQEGRQISSDELGLLILGALPSTALPHQEVTFPCRWSCCTTSRTFDPAWIQSHFVQEG